MEQETEWSATPQVRRGHRARRTYSGGSLPTPSVPSSCTNSRLPSINGDGHIIRAVPGTVRPQARRPPSTLGWLASGVLTFLCGALLCLALFWWRYGPLLQRQQLYAKTLHRQRQLQYRQRDLLRNLRKQLQLLQEEEGGNMLSSTVDCSKVLHDTVGMPPVDVHRLNGGDPGGDGDEDIGGGLQEVQDILLSLEKFSTSTTTTTTTSGTSTTTTFSTLTGTLLITSTMTSTSILTASTITTTTTTSTFTGTSTSTTSTTSTTTGTSTTTATRTSTTSTTTSSVTTRTTTTTRTITHTTTTTMTTTTVTTVRLPPYAYVMMAHDDSGGIPESLWGALAVARMLQRLSSFPLVLLTNMTHLPGGTPVIQGLRRLNVFVFPVLKVDMPNHLWNATLHPTWRVASWKLAVWKLTQFKKLIWLDADSVVSRSIDWLFTRPGMWAQRDDWMCKLQQKRVSTGILALYPNMTDYEGMLDYASSMEKMPHGDQELIATYFSYVRRQPINLLSDIDATFGECLGKARTPYLNPDGSLVTGFWSTPAFVHKSGGWANWGKYSNVCFSINMTLQQYLVHGTVLNMCHFHPFGAYWRDHLCAAARLVGIVLPEVTAFCEDACWYRGSREALPQGAEAALCSVIQTTIGYTDYYGQVKGWPPPEVPRI